MIDQSKSKGGIARAKKLSQEERSLISRKGALIRWNKDAPKATHYGILRIGELKIPCAVLENGMRVLSETGIAESFGSRTGGAIESKRLALIEGRAPLPIFVASKRLKPFISKELEDELSRPMIYTVGSNVFQGFSAELLPQICDVWLKAREADALQVQQKMRAQKAEILMRGLAKIGIIALVDEATGFQKERTDDALAIILEKFIAKELCAWVKTFPAEFYEQLYRIRGIKCAGDLIKRPSYFGHLTNDMIYKRLAPGILEELRKRVPKIPGGSRKHQLHRKLSPEFGHPKLIAHLDSVVTVMKLTDDGDYDGFIQKLDRVKPKY